MVFILPSVFFSGFIFPRETMPWIFYAIGAVLPATYFIELMRAIVLRGASLADFWLNLVVLGGMGAGFVRLCALRFKTEDRVRRRPDSPAAGTGLHIDLCWADKPGSYRAVRCRPGPA